MSDSSHQIERIRNATSLEEIQEIVRQFPSGASGDGGILYSGKVGDIRSEVIAKDLARQTGLPIINDTLRAQFLTETEDAIRDAVARIFETNGQTPYRRIGLTPDTALTAMEICP